MTVSTVRLANLNTYKLRLADRGTAAWRARVQTVREIAPDVLALQEIVVDEARTGKDRWEEVAARTVRAFAADCQLTAEVEETAGYLDGIAMASNSHRPWFTALVWNPATVTYVPESYRPYGAPDFWHGVTTASFSLGTGDPLTVISYHGDPFRPDFRANEALRLKGICRTVGGVKKSVVLGDFNALSAAVLSDQSGQERYYDPECYRDQDHDDLEYQVIPETIGGEQLADRRQTRALLRGGFMVDAAAHLGAPWEATVGHWENGKGDPDPWGERRIDLVLASRPVAPALVSYQTHRSVAARAASDHLPISVGISTEMLTEEV
ncbi:endonuclease/exonuclease/phosphatase family protein [Streptomyces sp. NPDC048416]|uniref:endonuclease/exonuclease/phosphatase family protein n=1 Tax=Streptomyces sp. NPDC048416 TaxID=3365546 RepID=UPI00371032BC